MYLKVVLSRLEKNGLQPRRAFNGFNGNERGISNLGKKLLYYLAVHMITYLQSSEQKSME